MYSKSEFNSSSLGSFPKRGDMNLLFNGFEGSNEEKMVRQQEEEVL